MATSSASLDQSKGSNWVEETSKKGGGGLPPGVRKVARALKEQHPEWPLSRCIATALSMSKKWAAKGSAKGAANVAGWEALRARNATRKTVKTSHPLADGTTIELSHDATGQVIELARYVRTPEGARRYKKPIGTLIGGTSATDRMAGPALPRAMRTERAAAASYRGTSDAALRAKRAALVSDHGAAKQQGAAGTSSAQRRRLAEARAIDGELKRRASGTEAKKQDRTGKAASLTEVNRAKRAEKQRAAAKTTTPATADAAKTNRGAATPAKASAAPAKTPAGPITPESRAGQAQAKSLARAQAFARAPAEQRAELARRMSNDELANMDGAMGRALGQTNDPAVRKVIEAKRADITAEQKRRSDRDAYTAETSRRAAAARKEAATPDSGQAKAERAEASKEAAARRDRPVAVPKGRDVTAERSAVSSAADAITRDPNVIDETDTATLRRVDREMQSRAERQGSAPGALTPQHRAVRQEIDRRGAGIAPKTPAKASTEGRPDLSDVQSLSDAELSARFVAAKQTLQKASMNDRTRSGLAYTDARHARNVLATEVRRRAQERPKSTTERAAAAGKLRPQPQQQAAQRDQPTAPAAAPATKTASGSDDRLAKLTPEQRKAVEAARAKRAAAAGSGTSEADRARAKYAGKGISPENQRAADAATAARNAADAAKASIKPGVKVKSGLRSGTVDRLERRNGIDGAVVSFPGAGAPRWQPLSGMSKADTGDAAKATPGHPKIERVAANTAEAKKMIADLQAGGRNPNEQARKDAQAEADRKAEQRSTAAAAVKATDEVTPDLPDSLTAEQRSMLTAYAKKVNAAARAARKVTSDPDFKLTETKSRNRLNRAAQRIADARESYDSRAKAFGAPPLPALTRAPSKPAGPKPRSTDTAAIDAAKQELTRIHERLAANEAGGGRRMRRGIQAVRQGDAQLKRSAEGHRQGKAVEAKLQALGVPDAEISEAREAGWAPKPSTGKAEAPRATPAAAEPDLTAKRDAVDKARAAAEKVVSQPGIDQTATGRRRIEQAMRAVADAEREHDKVAAAQNRPTLRPMVSDAAPKPTTDAVPGKAPASPAPSGGSDVDRAKKWSQQPADQRREALKAMSDDDVRKIDAAMVKAQADTDNDTVKNRLNALRHEVRKDIARRAEEAQAQAYRDRVRGEVEDAARIGRQSTAEQVADLVKRRNASTPASAKPTTSAKAVPGTAENVQARQDAQGRANRRAEMGLFPEKRDVPKTEGTLFGNQGGDTSSNRTENARREGAARVEKAQAGPGSRTAGVAAALGKAGTRPVIDSSETDTDRQRRENAASRPPRKGSDAARFGTGPDADATALMHKTDSGMRSKVSKMTDQQIAAAAERLRSGEYDKYGKRLRALGVLTDEQTKRRPRAGARSPEETELRRRLGINTEKKLAAPAGRAVELAAPVPAQRAPRTRGDLVAAALGITW